MLTHLYILTGPLKGYKLRLEPGFTFGRKTATYNLKDSKASEIHCIIGEKEGRLYIIDNGSKNGLWVDQEKVQQAELKHKQRIMIGRTRLEVRQRQASAIDELPEEKRDWRSILNTLNKDLAQSISDPPPAEDCRPLSPPLKLTFTRGLQINTSWTLGYGPREIGTAQVDLNIIQEGAPQNCFTITPTSEGHLFSTDFKEIVLLNDTPVETQLLENGDTIKIIDTEIHVEFFL